MRHSHLACVLLLVLSTGCTAAPHALDQPIALVKASPTPTPTATPQPTSQPLPPSAPFVLGVNDIQLANTSNAAMFAAGEPPVDEAVALDAVRAATARLEGFLNAMFVAPDTRLTSAAIATVLDPSGLVPGAAEGLGVLARDDVLGTVAGSAAATAQVQLEQATLGTVTLFYSASLELVLEQARGPVAQQGVASFVDRGAGMQLVAIEADTTYGGALAEVLG